MTTQFQTIVEKVLKGHDLFEKFDTQTDFHVRLEQAPYEPLVIERHGESIYVAHYAKDACGEEICDPDVELHFPDWTPVDIHWFGQNTSQDVYGFGLAFDKKSRNFSRNH